MDDIVVGSGSNVDLSPYLDMINHLISQAEFKTLIAMVISICMSLLISLFIYIRCKTRPGQPALQFFSLLIFPILVFFLVSYVSIRPFLQECDQSDDTVVSVHCIETNILNEIKKAPFFDSDVKLIAFDNFKSNELFISVMPKKYLISAIGFCFFYPWFLLFYTRRRVQN